MWSRMSEITRVDTPQGRYYQTPLDGDTIKFHAEYLPNDDCSAIAQVTASHLLAAFELWSSSHLPRGIVVHEDIDPEKIYATTWGRSLSP
jgi:hypothetical protein